MRTLERLATNRRQTIRERWAHERLLAVVVLLSQVTMVAALASHLWALAAAWWLVAGLGDDLARARIMLAKRTAVVRWLADEATESITVTGSDGIKHRWEPVS